MQKNEGVANGSTFASAQKNQFEGTKVAQYLHPWAGTRKRITSQKNRKCKREPV